MNNADLFKGLFEHYSRISTTFVNDACNGKEPWQIILYTFATTCLMFFLFRIISLEQSLGTRLKKYLFLCVRKIPWVRRKIEAELNKARIAIEKDLHEADEDMRFFTQLPECGLRTEDIVDKATRYSKLGSFDYLSGKVSGAVYSDDRSLTDLNTQIYNLFCWSNPLHPDIFPGCRKMEAEVVRMACGLFNGDDDTCGTVTSGGTESIILACLAYRNLAYAKGIRRPEIIAPVTVHAAFDKAANMFGMKLVHVPLDSNLKVDVGKMRGLIGSRTCMLVGSCPNFPHGIIDPIEDIAKLGRKHGIPVHVDACLGGFLVCFMEQCGYELKPFDFRVSGVTSISADTHKYAYAPKGTSVLLYSNTTYRQHQYFCQPDWPGGIYASPTLAGSRCGANIAVCWATLLCMGKNGYIERTRRIIDTTRSITDRLHRIEGITVLGEPEVSVVAFTSYVFNIYVLCDQMTKLGWNLNILQFPAAVHLCVTAKHTKAGVVDSFIRDIESVSASLIRSPVVSMGGMAAIYGTSQNLPDRSLVNEMANVYLDACYSVPPFTDVDSIDN